MVGSHLRKIRHFGGHFFQSLREHVDPNYQVWAKRIWQSVTSRNVAAPSEWGTSCKVLKIVTTRAQSEMSYLGRLDRVRVTMFRKRICEV